MRDRASVQWQYYPADLFESHFILELPDGVLAFNQGTAEFAYLERRTAIDDDDVQRLGNTVAQVLDAQSVARGIRSSMETPSKHFVDDAGNRTLHLQDSVGASTSTSAHFKIVDKSGRVVRDSRAEAQDASKSRVRKALALAVQYPEVHALNRSYAASLSNPKHSLSHLFEVLETLEKVLGGRSNVSAYLGVSKSRISELGRLANDQPLLEGRHRGQHFDALRPATAQEIELARAIALELIDAYVKYRT